MSFKRMILCGMMLGLLILPCMASASSTGSVKGQLHKNSASGAALSGAKVTCGGESDKTDDNGKFKIKGIKAGNQTIKFSKDGYESYQTTVKIKAGETGNVGDRWLTEKTTTDKTKPVINKLMLSPSSMTEGGTVVISYTVSDSGGSGLRQVELWKGKDKGNLGHYKTDQVSGNGPVSGQFKDSPSPAGTYYYGIHVLDNKDNLAYDNGALPVVVSVASQSVGSVSGKLHKNSASGTALSNVEVKCGGKSSTTGSDGTFKLKEISAGNQSISFSKEGYESYQTTIPIVAGKTANIGDRWLTEITRTVSSNLSPDWNSSVYRADNHFWSSGYAPKEFYPSGRSPHLGDAKGNCTWYAYGRLLELGYKKSDINALTGQANQWANQAKNSKENFRVDQTPQLHSIAQSDTLNYGHVAVVEAVNNDGTINISESSYCPNCKNWNFLLNTREHIDKKVFTNYIHVLQN